ADAYHIIDSFVPVAGVAGGSVAFGLAADIDVIVIVIKPPITHGHIKIECGIARWSDMDAGVGCRYICFLYRGTQANLKSTAVPQVNAGLPADFANLSSAGVIHRQRQLFTFG